MNIVNTVIDKSDKFVWIFENSGFGTWRGVWNDGKDSIVLLYLAKFTLIMGFVPIGTGSLSIYHNGEKLGGTSFKLTKDQDDKILRSIKTFKGSVPTSEELLNSVMEKV